MTDPQSCGQCECCQAWREGTNEHIARLTRECDEARELMAQYMRYELERRQERDVARALLRKYGLNCGICIGCGQVVARYRHALGCEIEAALEGR